MLISRNIHIPLFLRIGRELITELPSILDEHHVRFRRPVVVTGPRGHGIGAARVAERLGGAEPVVVADNAIASVERVARVARERQADLFVGFGGGTPLDVAKYAAALERTNFLAIPTTPSNDGIASPIAVIRRNGVPESVPARMPIGVVADLGILREAPEPCIRAGLGDLVANLSAIADWELACRRGRDRMDDFARLLSLTGAEAILRLADDEGGLDLHDDELLESLINGLVLSGIAMEIAGSSRPCSGAEHLFSHAVDRLVAQPAMHGVQVGLGTILMAALRDEDWSALRDRMQRLGVEVSATAAGLAEDTVVAALIGARATRPDRYTLLDEVELTPARALEVARATGVV